MAAGDPHVSEFTCLPQYTGHKKSHTASRLKPITIITQLTVQWFPSFLPHTCLSFLLPQRLTARHHDTFALVFLLTLLSPSVTPADIFTLCLRASPLVCCCTHNRTSITREAAVSGRLTWQRVTNHQPDTNHQTPTIKGLQQQQH